MAIETLEGIDKIGGFDVIVMDVLRENYPEKFNESGSMDWKWFEKDIRPNNFIYVRQDKNSLSFTLQNGAIKENGINGCQVETIIEAAKLILLGLDKKFSCRENKTALVGLQTALNALANRKKDRETRGVEGESRA